MNSTCSFPEAHVNLNKTVSEATEVLTTSNMMLRAYVTLCNSKIVSISHARWEIFFILNENQLTDSFLRYDVHNGSEYLLQPITFCEDCYPTYLFVRFTAQVNELRIRNVDDFGVLKIVEPELVAIITGPQEAKKGFEMDVVLNASESYDPDIRSVGTLSFIWKCKRDKETDFKVCKHGRTAANGKLLLVDINRLKSNHTHEFKLLVSKGYRTTSVVHGLKVFPAIDVRFRFVIQMSHNNPRRQAFWIIKGLYLLFEKLSPGLHGSTSLSKREKDQFSGLNCDILFLLGRTENTP